MIRSDTVYRSIGDGRDMKNACILSALGIRQENGRRLCEALAYSGDAVAWWDGPLSVFRLNTMLESETPF
jgi:hypothetical protein